MERNVRASSGYTVLVVSELHHRQGTEGYRECPECEARWTVSFDRGDSPETTTVRVWCDGTETTEALLDWYGNNAAVECCPRQPYRYVPPLAVRAASEA